MPHIFQKLLAIRFFWCIALVWDRKFLLLGFLASVYVDISVIRRANYLLNQDEDSSEHSGHSTSSTISLGEVEADKEEAQRRRGYCGLFGVLNELCL